MPNKDRGYWSDEEKAARYDELHATGLGVYVGEAEKVVAQWLAETSGQRPITLDAGCGTGKHLAYLNADAEICVGVDISRPMLVQALDQYPDVLYVIGDVEGLPFEDSSFDLIVFARVIQHLKDPKQAIAELSRVLKDDGQLITLFYNATTLENMYKTFRQSKFIYILHFPIMLILRSLSCACPNKRSVFEKIERIHPFAPWSIMDGDIYYSISTMRKWYEGHDLKVIEVRTAILPLVMFMRHFKVDFLLGALSQQTLYKLNAFLLKLTKRVGAWKFLVPVSHLVAMKGAKDKVP